MKNTTVRSCWVLALSWWLVAMATSGGFGKAFGQIGDGACCFPDGSCAVVNVFSCTSAGGFFRGGTSCATTVCTGACCRADGNCQAGFSQLACTGASGVFLGIASACAGQTCGGACCQDDGTCRISNNVACGGSEVFHGLGSVCADVDCAGACCETTGNCRTSNSAACAEPEIFHGLDSECADVDCAGACCLPNGGCLETSEFDCTGGRGGVFQGLDAACQDAVCVGACCLPNKGCNHTGFGSCQSLLGVFQGLGSVCGDDCPTVMPTAFTYQGQLKRNGVPHSGLVDASFSLWLSPTGQDQGNQIGGTVHVLDLEIVNGLFTTELDFGANNFNGNARWLQIELRDHDSPDPFTTLSPRQPLTPVPYALQTRGIVVRQDGNVGIGTKSPQSALHVAGTGFDSNFLPGVHIARSIAGDAKIELVNNGGTPYIDFLNDGSTDFDGRIRLTGDNSLAIEGVLVGIGPTSPATKLHVDGGSDLTPGGGGILMVGSTGGENIGFDNNEIMARNNGAPSTLFLNHEGGAVETGGDVVVLGAIDIGIENVNLLVQDTGTASLNCPAGKRALSGGCACVGAILVSQPSGSGWFCDCRDENFVQVFVRCARVR